MKARKQSSPEAIRKWAKDHHLPELLEMKPELEQRQPMVEQLAERGTSTTLQPIRWARHHIEEHMDAAGGVNNAT